jgi:hypothetical protein
MRVGVVRRRHPGVPVGLKTEVGIDLDALEAPFNATIKLTDGGADK